MIRIDEEVEPVIRIPIELREQRANREPVESWYKNNATDLSEYRRADGMSYRIQKGFITDIAHTERILHHELDNYVMDMSKELREAMEEAERALKKAKDLLSKEAV